MNLARETRALVRGVMRVGDRGGRQGRGGPAGRRRRSHGCQLDGRRCRGRTPFCIAKKGESESNSGQGDSQVYIRTLLRWAGRYRHSRRHDGCEGHLLSDIGHGRARAEGCAQALADLRGGVARGAYVDLGVEQRGAGDGRGARDARAERLVRDLALEDAHLGEVCVEAGARAGDEVDDALGEDDFLGGEVVDLSVGGGDFSGDERGFRRWGARGGGGGGDAGGGGRGIGGFQGVADVPRRVPVNLRL